MQNKHKTLIISCFIVFNMYICVVFHDKGVLRWVFSSVGRANRFTILSLVRVQEHPQSFSGFDELFINNCVFLNVVSWKTRRYLAGG